MALQKFKAPPLPVPPKEYDQNYMNQLVRAIGNYFNLLDSQSPLSINNVTLTAVPQSNDFPPVDLKAGTGFQLSGEDVFRVKVEGITPEPIPTDADIAAAVSAGVATAEAYADANFVNLAGDTMTGNLGVPVINATTVNATTANATTVNTSNLTGSVSVPSGSSVAGAVAGSVRAPGTVIQVQNKSWSTETALGNGTWTSIAASALTVTPLYSNSRMLCVADFHGHAGGAGACGFAFRICMDGVALNTPSVFHETYSGTTDLYGRSSKCQLFSITNTTAKVFTLEAGLYNATNGQNNYAGLFQSFITVYEIAQ